MSERTLSFYDTDGDVVEVLLDSDTGEVEFDGPSIFSFTVETTKDLTETLIDHVNSLTPVPTITSEITPTEPVATVTASDDSRDNWNRTAFAAAETLGLKVAFRYAKGDGGNIESRELAEVYDVRETKGVAIVTGFDSDRDDVRAYRLDRVKGYVSVRP
jgi:predicted DNA-binding transcriptional regulator YafY